MTSTSSWQHCRAGNWLPCGGTNAGEWDPLGTECPIVKWLIRLFFLCFLTAVILLAVLCKIAVILTVISISLSPLQDSGEPRHGKGPWFYSQRAIKSLSGNSIPPAPAAPLARSPPSQRAVLQPRLQTEGSSLHRRRGRATVRMWQTLFSPSCLQHRVCVVRQKTGLLCCWNGVRGLSHAEQRVTWRLPHCLCWNAGLEKSAPRSTSRFIRSLSLSLSHLFVFAAHFSASSSLKTWRRCSWLSSGTWRRTVRGCTRTTPRSEAMGDDITLHSMEQDLL